MNRETLINLLCLVPLIRNGLYQFVWVFGDEVHPLPKIRGCRWYRFNRRQFVLRGDAACQQQ